MYVLHLQTYTFFMSCTIGAGRSPELCEANLMRGVSTSGGKKRRDYLKIDSSYIGMESARRYTSVERKSISMTVVNAVAMQGRQNGKQVFLQICFRQKRGKRTPNRTWTVSQR